MGSGIFGRVRVAGMSDALLSLDGFCKVKWVHEQTVCVYVVCCGIASYLLIFNCHTYL